MYRSLIAAVALCTILFTACQTTTQRPVNQDLIESIEQRRTNPSNRLAIDTAIGLLRTGDIVARTGNDMTSYMLCQLNQTDKTYSHCGLVMVEDGYPFVYHSIGGEANPDARMRRDSAAHWLSPGDNLGFGIARMPFNPSQTDSLHLLVKKVYRQRPLFDMDFDIVTDDKLYCAEFIYKVVNEATADSLYIKPIRVLGYYFVGVDDVFLNSHATTICRIRFK